MLVVPCACGVKLRVKDEVAGHRVKCPKCGEVIRAPKTGSSPASAPAPVAPATAVPRAKAVATPSAAKPRAIPRPEKPAPSDDSAPLDLLEQLSSGEPLPDLAPLPVLAAEEAVELGYARDPSKPSSSLGVSSKLHSTISGPHRGFWRDVLFAYRFPFASTSNAVNTAIVMAIGALQVLPFCFARIIYAWLASVYMNAVTDTATGSDEFSGPKMDGSWYDSLIRPLFLYVMTFLLAELPCVAYLALSISGVIQLNLIVLGLWTAFGLFLWPIFMLLASLDSLALVFRIDLVLATIARTFLPYLAVWVSLLVPFGIMAVWSIGTELLQISTGPQPGRITPSAITNVLIIAYVREAVSIYLLIVSMRIIGLYYLHFKHRFAFKLE